MLKDYESEIANLYETVEASSNSGIALPPSWDLQDSLRYARGVVQKFMGKPINDDQDIFQLGADR